MSTPNIPSGLVIHAAGSSDGAGALQAGASNIQSVVRNAVGDYTVTYGEPISDTERTDLIELIGGPSIYVVQARTDTTINFLVFDQDPVTPFAFVIAADRSFKILCIRHAV